VALIAVDAAGENQILVAPGANATLEKLTGAELAAVTGAQALVCQLETPLTAVVQAATAVHAAGVPVVVNAAPARFAGRPHGADTDDVLTGLGLTAEEIARLRADRVV
jgi:sugar/nucleoside kinase (ribokinase family)